MTTSGATLLEAIVFRARSSWEGLVRVAVLTLIGTAALAPSRASAQGRRFETHSMVGAFIPTGDQRDAQKDALMMGTGLGFHISPTITVVGAFAWSDNTAKEVSGEPDLKIYSYDLGVEYQPFDTMVGSWWHLRPFVGGGAGGRTYDTKDDATSSETDLTGYAALGMQADYKRVGFRIEGRDYISSYDGLTGSSDRATRNDVVLSSGFVFHW
jgi:hypothetical protein